MNFTNDFKWHSNMEIWFFKTLLIWILVLIFTVFSYVSYYSTIYGNTEGAVLPNSLFFLTIPIACVLSNFVNYIGHITEEANEKYSRFKYSEFKKWYEFRPERFIFEQASYLYFIVDPEKFKKQGEIDLWNKDIEDGLVLCLIPKTFLDYCLFGIFIGLKYKKFEKKVDISKTSENEREKTRNLFILLNSLQSEVEKELKDSNKIIEEEIEKMRGVNMEREG